MEDPIVIDDTTNVADPATETAEQKATRLEETNKKLFERAKKAEAEAKALKEKPLISEPTKPSDILKADEFKLYRMGYSENEIDLIMHNGGVKILEDKTSPIVLGLEATKTQRRAEEAASAATDSSGLSEIERKYTEADLRNMKPDEIAALIGYANK
jgi:hypothetical protein